MESDDEEGGGGEDGDDSERCSAPMLDAVCKRCHTADAIAAVTAEAVRAAPVDAALAERVAQYQKRADALGGRVGGATAAGADYDVPTPVYCSVCTASQAAAFCGECSENFCVACWGLQLPHKKGRPGHVQTAPRDPAAVAAAAAATSSSAGGGGGGSLPASALCSAHTLPLSVWCKREGRAVCPYCAVAGGCKGHKEETVPREELVAGIASAVAAIDASAGLWQRASEGAEALSAEAEAQGAAVVARLTATEATLAAALAATFEGLRDKAARTMEARREALRRQHASAAAIAAGLHHTVASIRGSVGTTVTHPAAPDAAATAAAAPTAAAGEPTAAAAPAHPSAAVGAPACPLPLTAIAAMHDAAAAAAAAVAGGGSSSASVVAGAAAGAAQRSGFLPPAAQWASSLDVDEAALAAAKAALAAVCSLKLEPAPAVEGFARSLPGDSGEVVITWRGADALPAGAGRANAGAGGGGGAGGGKAGGKRGKGRGKGSSALEAAAAADPSERACANLPLPAAWAVDWSRGGAEEPSSVELPLGLAPLPLLLHPSATKLVLSAAQARAAREAGITGISITPVLLAGTGSGAVAAGASVVAALPGAGAGAGAPLGKRPAASSPLSPATAGGPRGRAGLPGAAAGAGAGAGEASALSHLLALPSLALTIRLPDPATMGRRDTLMLQQTEKLYCCCLAGDGKRVVTGSETGTVAVWDAASGDCVRRMRPRASAEALYSLAHMGGARGLVAAGTASGNVLIWDTTNGVEAGELSGHTAVVRCVVFLPAEGQGGQSGQGDSSDASDGDWLFTASDDKSVRVWKVNGGAGGHARRLFKTLEGHTEAVFRVVPLPERHDRIASAGTDKTVRIWNWRAGLCLQTLERHTGWICGLLALPDGRLLSGGSDKIIRVWRPDGSSNEGSYSYERGVSTEDHVWQLLRLAQGDVALVPVSRTSPKISILDGGSLAARKGLDGADKALTGHGNQIHAVALPDGRVFSVAEDDSARIWGLDDLATME
jgi:WD40 repeat protein